MSRRIKTLSKYIRGDEQMSELESITMALIILCLSNLAGIITYLISSDSELAWAMFAFRFFLLFIIIIIILESEGG
jgi:hypothetical protein